MTFHNEVGVRPLGVLANVVAVIFWCFPPRGDDAYYHSVGAVEQVRAWQEGAVFPDYQRGWSGGTGSFAPTVYAPIPMAIQSGLAWLVGDGQRAVGFSLSLVVLAAAVSFTEAIGRPEAVLLVAVPYTRDGGWIVAAGSSGRVGSSITLGFVDNT